MLVLILIVSPVHAKVKEIFLDELVNTADVIVVATLIDHQAITVGTNEFSTATLQIDDMLFGHLEEAQTVVLKWENKTKLICPRIGLQGVMNKKGIWFLKRSNADYFNITSSQIYKTLNYMDNTLDLISERKLKIK